MEKEKHELLLEQFSQALSRFEEVLQQPKNDFMRDSAIQRFEFTIELAWKALKACLEWGEKVTCRSPASCIREAYRQGWIDYEQEWIDALRYRNQLSHIYKESMADDIYRQLPGMLTLFKKLEQKLRERTNH